MRCHLTAPEVNPDDRRRNFRSNSASGVVAEEVEEYLGFLAGKRGFISDQAPVAHGAPEVIVGDEWDDSAEAGDLVVGGEVETGKLPVTRDDRVEAVRDRGFEVEVHCESSSSSG